MNRGQQIQYPDEENVPYWRSSGAYQADAEQLRQIAAVSKGKAALLGDEALRVGVLEEAAAAADG